uniref:Mediator of RNA polymerase II transcription subunit 7 n=1 Tax=Romanomermis culicivorax TaxID=13658 RepID=A0A915KKH6_ROMCU
MDAPQISSTFPPPPNELKMYTAENLRTNFAPGPPPVVQGHYTMFGVQYNTDDEIVQPLEAQGIKRLYPTVGFNAKDELKKLNHSILANFLDLIEILIRCPGNVEKNRKLDDLKLLFFNMHHLINEYRVYQAKDTIKLMLTVEKHERLEMAKKFSLHSNSVANSLQNCIDQIPGELCNAVTLKSELQAIVEQFSSNKDVAEECDFDKAPPVSTVDEILIEQSDRFV